MTRYVALFLDPVDPAGLDEKISAAHFAYLEAQMSRIKLAGGLRPDAGLPFCGALWIIEAGTLAEAEALVEADPYRLEGIWSRPQIFAWGKAPFYRTVEL